MALRVKQVVVSLACLPPLWYTSWEDWEEQKHPWEEHTQGRSDAQSPASRAHLVERSGLLCALHTGSVSAAGSAGRRSRLAGLAAGGLLLCLPRRFGEPECLPGGALP